jgi:hypothetical protein
MIVTCIQKALEGRCKWWNFRDDNHILLLFAQELAKVRN